MRHSNPIRLIYIAVATAAASFFAPQSCLVAEDASDATDTKQLQQGRAIYVKSCAECRGERGQGVVGNYKEPLAGDLSVRELSALISKTMPEGEPNQCVGADAQAVAAYVYQAFYSEAARTRLHPPRVRLTHLTGSQLQSSLADLYGHFAGGVRRESRHGINGTYFNGARWRDQNKKIERVDSRINFDWKHDGPGSGIDPKDFFIRWRGGIKVLESGRYEIVIRSTCAFICNLGRYDREFINNRVQSGDKTEFRKSIVLTAGRVYPLQIDLYQRKRKTAQPPARISLFWVPPHGIQEVIPERSLLAVSATPMFSLQTKLPPDDRSYGYERGLSIDRQWDASTTSAAVEFAQIAVEELWPNYQARHKASPNTNRATLRKFLAEMVETAFRGPLDEPSRRFYIDQQVDQTENDAEAIKRGLLVTLKSPRFLYPGLDRDRSVSQRAANRLALTLFDSLPSDAWLIKLAREDKLTTEEQIRSAASRMVTDDRTQGKTRELMYEWLNLGHFGEIIKNSAYFPDFNPEVVSDLKSSLDAFLDDVIWSEASDFRQLFLADATFTTTRMEGYYGADWRPVEKSSAELSRSITAKSRVGLLSHPYLMSGLAYQDSTSPIHRGVFLIRNVLGRTLRPPKDAFTPLSPKLHPDLTTRQRIELQTSPKSCQVCHAKINGLGFALENFDAVGRFRQKEGEKIINSVGHYTARDGNRVTFRGASELAEFLANSHDTRRAFVNRAFLHFVKQPPAAYGVDRLDELTKQFRDSQFHIRNLLVEIAVVAATQPSATRPTGSSSASPPKEGS